MLYSKCTVITDRYSSCNPFFCLKWHIAYIFWKAVLFMKTCFYEGEIVDNRSALQGGVGIAVGLGIPLDQ